MQLFTSTVYSWATVSSNVSEGQNFSLHMERQERKERGREDRAKEGNEGGRGTDRIFKKRKKKKRPHPRRKEKKRDSWRVQVHLREGRGRGNANELGRRSPGKGKAPTCISGDEELLVIYNSVLRQWTDTWLDTCPEADVWDDFCKPAGQT